jgi:DNA-binding beta-propeller fold protein YncE
MTGSTFKKTICTLSFVPMLAVVMCMAQVQTINVGNSPASLVINPATNKVFVANDCGNDPSCQSGNGSVTVIDGGTLQTQTVQVADYPYPIAINSLTNKVYAATCGNDPSCQTGTVSVIDGTTLQVQSVTTGVNTNFVAINPATNKIYATSLGCTSFPCNVVGTLTVIDGRTLATQSINVGYDPYSVMVNPVTNKIYVVNECGNDPSCSSAGTITVVDGATLGLQTVSVDYVPLFGGVNTVTNTIYVANNGGADGSGNPGTMTVINGATLATQRVQLQVYPAPVKVNAVTNKIYAGNRCGSDPTCVQPPSVSVIDGSSLAVTNVSICTAETFPADFIDIDPVTNTVFLPCNGRSSQGTTGNSVTILNGGTNGITSVAVGDYPNAAAVSAPTNKIYVVNTGDATVSQFAGPNATPVQYVDVTPCRLVDTRPPNGSGPIPGGTSQSFVLPQLGNCGIPNNALAFSLNVTVLPQQRLGYLTIWPTGEDQPLVSTMNSPDGRIKANAAIVPAGYEGAVSVYVSDTTNVLLDIAGYFTQAGSQNFQFYPLTPCRIIDTRNGQNGGTLEAGVERDYAIAGNCGIPSNASAYSFNVTVLPTQGSLDYLTVWPQGEPRPTVSTLNDNTGTNVANAAIVPAGSNSTTAFYAHNHNTDLLLDVNGYFASPGQNGLSLYPTAPCRVLDTRQNNGQPFSGKIVVSVAGSPCAPPSSAEAYVFNATVVPPGPMPFLTLWPDTEQQPTVSTLNARDGFITSNMAIVPTVNGSIDAYAQAMTHLILDTSGYFAPQSQDWKRIENRPLQPRSGATGKMATVPATVVPEKIRIHGKGN